MPDHNENIRQLQALFLETADVIARQTLFIRRHRQISAQNFLTTVIMNSLSHPNITLFELQQSYGEHGIRITESALCQRFTESCSKFLKAMLGIVLTQLTSKNQDTLALTSSFNGIYVDDCTKIPLPKDLAETFPGCGNSVTKTNAELSTFCRIDVRSGQIIKLLYDAGKTADITMQRQAGTLPQGCLHLADRGFFDIKHLRNEDAAGVFFVTRIPAGTTVMVGEKELGSFLKELKDDKFDVTATLGQTEQYTVRLVGFRVDAPTAERHRRQSERASNKQGRQSSERQKALCDWAFYATNLPDNKFSLQEITTLYRIRWQIELLFKLWKSEGKLDESNGKKGWRCLCEFYGKLLGLLVANWIMLERCDYLGGVSRVKMLRVVQRGTIGLLSALWRGDEQMLAILWEDMWRKLMKIPIQHQRKKNPTLPQLLTKK